MARRPYAVFNLSFLDVMSCGFGAVVLFFIVLSALSSKEADASLEGRSSEAGLLAAELTLAEAQQEQIANEIRELQAALAREEAAAARIRAEQTAAASQLDRLRSRRDDAASEIRTLTAQLQQAERRLEELAKAEVEAGESIREVAGEGQQQYLTGLTLGGDRVLFLVDTSASMLDDTIVNIIRRRNMSEERRRAAPKWQRVLATVDWLTARMREVKEFQIYGFDTAARPVVADTSDRWIAVEDGRPLTRAVGALRRTSPAGGTSLHAALDIPRRLSPPPDNVYLIIDGLPTQGPTAPSRSTITPAERLRAFRDAVKRVPEGVPVHVILLPLEGDPDAASAYWELAQRTGGSFLNPSQDWP